MHRTNAYVLVTRDIISHPLSHIFNMVSHLNTDMVRSSSSESVMNSQSLASSVNKQPQAWGHYIKKLNTQLNELISRNEALLTADEITQELCNELN